MKILFCDLLFEHGNRHVDNSMIELMTRDHDVFLLMNEDFISDKSLGNGRLKILGNKFTETPKNVVGRVVQILRRMKLTSKYAKELKPDVIYISVYETRTFPLGLLFFRKTSNIVVLENYNIDYLKYRFQNLAYRVFANKIHHMVYEPFFKDYLVSIKGVSSALIHVVPHFYYPPTNAKHSQSRTLFIKHYDCVGLSGSNDPNVIEEIIKIESEEHYFENNGIRCYIKSPIHQFESDYLKVSNEFLKTEEYDSLYYNSKVVFVPFPTSYVYRMSGCIVDAFSVHKPVVSSNLELAKFYHSKYGSIITPCENAREMLIQIKNILSISNTDFDFSGFEKDHSDGTIKACLNNMLNEITQTTV